MSVLPALERCLLTRLRSQLISLLLNFLHNRIHCRYGSDYLLPGLLAVSLSDKRQSYDLLPERPYSFPLLFLRSCHIFAVHNHPVYRLHPYAHLLTYGYTVYLLFLFHSLLLHSNPLSTEYVPHRFLLPAFHL